MKPIDLTGKTFGHLTVLTRYTGKHPGTGTYWVVRCACGTEFAVYGYNLRRGHTKSCGCIRSEAIRNSLQGRDFLKSLAHTLELFNKLPNITKQKVSKHFLIDSFIKEILNA